MHLKEIFSKPINHSGLHADVLLPSAESKSTADVDARLAAAGYSAEERKALMQPAKHEHVDL